MSDTAKSKTFCAHVGQYTNLEDLLCLWIDGMRRANLLVPPSLATAKAKFITSSVAIPKEEFKASWQWLSKFRACHGLQKLMLHGEGEVNKDDPKLLAALLKLYAVIEQYDLEYIYNMDETGLFFRLLPRYSLLMPNEDMLTTRGKEKSKDVYRS